MQKQNVNEVVANNSSYTFDRAVIRGLADKIANYVSDLDAGRSRHHIEIDGYGVEFDYSADLVHYRGGEPDEIITDAANQHLKMTGLWRLDDYDSTELENEREYLNYLLN